VSDNDTTARLRNDLREMREARDSLNAECYDFLSAGSPDYGYTGGEQVGETLLLLATWRATKDLSKSSVRLERVTWGLAVLTLVLLILTAILAFSV